MSEISNNSANLPWLACIIGIHNMEMTTKMTTNNLPTTMSSQSLALGLALFQMSIVNIVLLELKMDVSDDMRAAIITANIRPRAPFGMSLMTSSG